MNTGSPISVLVPVYNNAETLRYLHQQLRSLLPHATLIFVNDCSSDTSLRELRLLSQHDNSTRVVEHTHRQGQHHALMSGLRCAADGAVVVLDADLQDDPQFILPLLAAIDDDTACFARKQGMYESPARLLSSWMFSCARSALGGPPLRTGTFFACGKNVRKRAIALHAICPPKTPVYFPSLVAQAAARVSTIPTMRRTRAGSEYTSRLRVTTALNALIATRVYANYSAKDAMPSTHQ